MTEERANYRTISILSIAHLINDTYSNFLPQFLPFLILVTKFSYAQSTFLISAFTISSSIIQPLVGYLIDKKGKSWMLYIGTLWMTVFLSLMGLTTQYWLLVVFAALAGMGTAAFHPQASSLMGKVSGSKKGFMMSSFMAMGNLGFALSPLIFIPLLNIAGLRSTMYLLIPGIMVSLFLFKFAQEPERDIKQANSNDIHPLRALFDAGGEIGKLVVVIVLRSAAYTGLIALLPNYFNSVGISILTSKNLLFLMLFAGAIGGITGGWLSDRFGRKTITVGSLVLATPTFFGFIYTAGNLSYILLALAGALLMGSFSVTVVAAQEIIPGSRGLASGITMGFSIGLGGLAITLFGWIADVYGLSVAVKLLFLLPCLAGIIGLLLKGSQVKQTTLSKTAKA